MNKNIVRSGAAALLLSAALVSSTALPAAANPTSTRTILEGLAAAAAIVTAVNVEHKHQLATTVQGYLPDGSTVYGDGRVVSPNGQSWYPGNQGESVACSNRYCSIGAANTYGTNGYYGNGNGGYYGNGNGGYYGNGNGGYYGNGNGGY